MALVLAALAEAHGWRPASVTLALAATPPALLLLRSHPAELGERPYGARAFVPRPPPAPDAARNTVRALPTAVRSRGFRLPAAAFAVCGASTNGVPWTHSRRPRTTTACRRPPPPRSSPSSASATPSARPPPAGSPTGSARADSSPSASRSADSRCWRCRSFSGRRCSRRSPPSPSSSDCSARRRRRPVPRPLRHAHARRPRLGRRRAPARRRRHRTLGGLARDVFGSYDPFRTAVLALYALLDGGTPADTVPGTHSASEQRAGAGRAP